MKNIIVEINGVCGIKGIPHELRKRLPPKRKPQIWSADEALAFKIIGIATASPTYVGFTLSDMWAHLRYFAAVDSSKADLRLRPEWADIDPHQKTILADDWGVGFSIQYLIENIHIVDFVPTGWWIKNVEKAVGKKLNFSKKKKGPPKLPDYICVDQWGYLHAIECKGTQASEKFLRKQVVDGQSQLINFHNGTLPSSIRQKFRGWMVGGLFVPQSKAKGNSKLLIVNPENSIFAEAMDQLGIDNVFNAIRITGLAQQLASVGFHRLATAIFDGQTSKAEANFLRCEKGRSGEIDFMGHTERNGKIIGQRSFRIFEKSFDVESRLGGRVLEFESSVPIELLESLTAVIDQGGVVDRDKVIGIIDTFSPLCHERPRGGLFKFKKASVPTWHSGKLGNQSWLESPYGIRFTSTIKEF